MIEQNEIQAIVNGVLSASKDLYTIENGKPKWKGVPDYYDGYKDAVHQMNRIKTHSHVDKFPEMLFKYRAPNENEEEQEWVRNNYKNTTHPVYTDYLSTVSRGLNDNNWSIIYPKGGTDAEDYNDYILNEIDVFESVESYVKNIVPSIRANDANGVMTISIKDQKTTMIDGEEVADDREKFEPQPLYFTAAQVVAWEWNTYGLFESHEKSLVSYGSKDMKIGRVFYFYDDSNIWKITQTGKFIDSNFTYEVIFAHEMGMFPCHKLKGVPSIKEDGDIYYTSRFYYSVDLLDWSLLYSNYLNVSIANVCFPFRWMAGDVCDFVSHDGINCNGGYIGVNDNGSKIECPSCKGAGMKVRATAMGTYLLRPKEGQDEGDTSFNAPMGYIAPGTETLEFTKKTAADYFMQAQKMMHIHTSNTEVKGSETATFEGIDQKAMFAFIQPDSNQTFDVFQFLLDVIGKVREGADFEGAKLIYPKSFDLRTDVDILQDIKIAREAGAPTHVINTLIHQYITSRFYAETETAKVSQLITSADRLLTLSNEEIVQRKAQNAIQNWEIVLHDSAFKFINDLIAANPDFLELELEQQIEQLNALAVESTPESLQLTRTNQIVNNLLP